MSGPGARVVDASAIGAIAFDEPDSARVLAAISGSRLLAPSILPYELVNTARNKARSYPQHREQWSAALELALLADITVMNVDFREVYALATEYELTSYDASYLWLSREYDAPLITLDRALQRAYARMRRLDS